MRTPDSVTLAQFDLDKYPRRTFQKEDLQDPCLALKTLIVSARRKQDFDWREFWVFWHGNKGMFLEYLSARWLLSVVDTWVDHSPHVAERLAGTTIAAFFGVEKWSMSLHLTTTDYLKTPYLGQPWFDWGLQSVSLGEGMDHHVNLIRRMDRELQELPRLWELWRALMKRYLEGEETTLRKLPHSRDLVSDVKGVLQ